MSEQGEATTASERSDLPNPDKLVERESPELDQSPTVTRPSTWSERLAKFASSWLAAMVLWFGILAMLLAFALGPVRQHFRSIPSAVPELDAAELDESAIIPAGTETGG